MRKNWKYIIFAAIIAFCTSAFPASANGIGTIDIGTLTPPVQELSSREAMLYAMAPDHLYPFIYDGTSPSTWRDIDTTNCIVGRLYVYNEKTCDVLQISNQHVITFTSTNEHMYFVTTDQSIVKSDYTGTALEVVYHAQNGEISMINAFGGYVYFVEDGCRVVVLDIARQTIHATLSSHSIMSAYMLDQNKLIWYDEAGVGTCYDTVSQESTLLIDEGAESALVSYYVLPDTYQNSASIQSSNVANFVGQPDAYNDIAFPLSNYPARPGTGYTPPEIRSRFVDGWSLQNQNPDPWIKTTYAGGAGECDGFAKYAHDAFWHIADWGRTRPSWDTGNTYTADHHGEYYEWTTKDQMIDFFEGLLRGSFVRYTSYLDETPWDGTHSYVFDGIDADGLGTWHYECNQDFNNGIGYQYYTFDLYYCKNKFVYEYVEHTLSTKSIQNTSRHKTACTNCTGYLLQSHTGTASYATESDVFHKVSYSCCTGTITQRHTIVSGSRDSCASCGWVEGMLIGNAPTPGLKE